MKATKSGANALAVAVSDYLDEHNEAVAEGPAHLRWIRVGKLGEEAGEVIDALIALEGSNPRKQAIAGEVYDALLGELLDAAATALFAYVHLTATHHVLDHLINHIYDTAERLAECQ